MRIDIKKLNQSVLGLAILGMALFTTNCEDYKAPAPISNAKLEQIEHIVADAETAPMHAEVNDDAADDPAIFVNPTQPEASLIVGTNKKEGLLVYNLKGEELYKLDCGLVNNVDLRQNVHIGAWQGNVVASSNRSGNLISIHELKESGELHALGEIETGLTEVYGFCLGVINGKTYAFVNDKDGRIQEYLLVEGTEVAISGKLERTFKVPTQPEGMVVDESYNTLFVGEEESGIWSFNLADSANTQGYLLPNTTTDNNPYMQYDLEGLTIYQASDSTGYLVASSQGSYSYCVFDRKEPHTFITAFRVTDGESIDGIEETDGLDVTSAYLGEVYPNGVAVIQDGFNFDGETKVPQNFKIVDWRKIQSVIDKK